MSSAAAPAPRRSNPFAVVIRVVVVTLAFGVLGLGVGGLLGIVAISIINLAGELTDMSFAIFAGGLPGAVIGLVVGFAVIVRSEQAAFRNAPS